MDRLAIGLVGCGAWVAATCTPTRRWPGVTAGSSGSRPCATHAAAAAEETAELIEDLLGVRPAVFSAHKELIASGLVEALDVVTDPSVHHLVASPALAAGLHVLCEKPLGITVRACRAHSRRSRALWRRAGGGRELPQGRTEPPRPRQCSIGVCSERCTS